MTKLEEVLETLSMKQHLFVEAYFANDYNGAEAVRVAGYNSKYPNKIAYQLLEIPKVKEAIQLMADKKIKEITVTEEYILRKLVKTIEKADDTNQLTALLRGLELAMKNLGMLRDKVEVTGKDGEAIQLEKVNNDAADFARSIARIAKRGGEDSSPGESTH